MCLSRRVLSHGATGIAPRIWSPRWATAAAGHPTTSSSNRAGRAGISRHSILRDLQWIRGMNKRQSASRCIIPSSLQSWSSDAAAATAPCTRPHKQPVGTAGPVLVVDACRCALQDVHHSSTLIVCPDSRLASGSHSALTLAAVITAAAAVCSGF